MTTEEIEIAKTLWNNTTFRSASFDKRFSRSMCAIAEFKPHTELSEKQSNWLYRLMHKYRKQVPELYEKYQHLTYNSILTPLT